MELLGAEVVMSPNHIVELLAETGENLAPVTIEYVDDGLQIYPHKEFDPNWHLVFNGKLIPVGYPTILSQYE